MLQHPNPYKRLQPSRNWNCDEYRFGFQGQEADNEIKGDGNSINYKYRVHDPRLGRFISIDPLTAKYPFYSPYAFSGNRVIDMVELEGLEPADPPTENGAIEQASVQGSDSDEKFSWMGWDGDWFRSTSIAAEATSSAWNWDDYGAQLYFNDDWYSLLMNSNRPEELKQKIFMSRYRFGYAEMSRGVQTMIGIGITAPLIFAGGAATATASASWLMRVGSGVVNWGGQFVANKINGDSWLDAAFYDVNWTSVGMSTLLAKPSFGNFLLNGSVSNSFDFRFNGCRTILNGDVQADDVLINTGLSIAFSYGTWGLSSLRSSFNYTNFLYMRNLDVYNPLYQTLSNQVMKVTLTTKGLGFGLGVTNNLLSR